MRCAKSCCGNCQTLLPLCCNENATSGRDSAMRLKVSSHQANSVLSLLRNLRRAGVLKYSSRISTLVPCAWAAGAAALCVPSAASIFQACAASACAAGQRELRHRRHAGQRLAAEAHAGDALQVVERGDLAGGMAHQRQRQLFLGDAAAVVAHPRQLDAAAFQLHRDLRRTRIQAVLQQFLQGRSGAFDHFAGGDLVDEEVGKELDRGHRRIITDRSGWLFTQRQIVAPTSHPLRGYESSPQYVAPRRVRQIVARQFATFPRCGEGFSIAPCLQQQSRGVYE